MIQNKSIKGWPFLLYLFILIGISSPAAVAAQGNEETVVEAVLFYSPTCSHCHYVITDVLMPMIEAHNGQLQIIGIDVTQPPGQELYQATIKRYQIPQEQQGVPTLVVGDTVLVGSVDIPEQFPPLVQAGFANGGIARPDVPGLDHHFVADAETTPAPTVMPQPTVTLPPIAAPTPIRVADASLPTAAEPAAPVYLAYFFDATCLACAQVSAELEQLQAQYPHLVVRSFDVHDEAATNEAMCEKYGVPEAERLLTPAIFIGSESLIADNITTARLHTLIESPETANQPPPWVGLEPEPYSATDRIVERFKQFSFLAVVGAGLLDGLNPCAFTTIIFFVSYLALVGRKGHEILLVGAAFTAAVFLTYLVMGLGLAEVIHQLDSFVLVGRLIYGITAVICLLLAAMSIVDYIKIRQGNLREITLQLPRALKQRIHRTIRTRSRMEGYLGAAFGAGVLVSVFELACTGQVYLPTIIFVTGISELRLIAVAYLVLYNLMFIVPLVAVFFVTYWGTSSQRLTTVFQANAGLVKLFTAVLFGVLGMWLGYMVLIA